MLSTYTRMVWGRKASAKIDSALMQFPRHLLGYRGFSAVGVLVHGQSDSEHTAKMRGIAKSKVNGLLTLSIDSFKWYVEVVLWSYSFWTFISRVPHCGGSWMKWMGAIQPFRLLRDSEADTC